MTPTQREEAARLIVEAATEGDKVVAEREGVDLRTFQRRLQRLRKRIDAGDDELSRLVADKKAKVEAGWADRIPGALRACVGFLEKAATDADAKDPAAIHAIAGAMKLLSETSATWKLLDARLARQNRPVPAPDGQAPAGGAGTGGAAGAGSHGSVVPLVRSR
jgi:hypothetical protein